ncbi:MAG: hypothetical protein O2945_09005 [Planctomycetota bacterium]|nr:hypothetical protein [Planctomycetota bacterium]
MERQSAPTLDTRLVILKCVTVTEHPCGKGLQHPFQAAPAATQVPHAT